MNKFFLIFLLYFMYCVMGYILECIYCSIIDKKFVLNRGFLIGPYLPLYGYGAMIITSFLLKYMSDPLVLFIMSAVVSTILEYFTSFFMEKIFKARWWDYSDEKYNINGRICLKNTLLFGIAGILIMYFVNPLFLKILESLSNNLLLFLGILFFTIYLIDTITSCMVIFKLRKNRKILKDSTEEISEKVKEILRKNRLLKKRLLNAFPRIKEHNIYNKLKELTDKK